MQKNSCKTEQCDHRHRSKSYVEVHTTGRPGRNHSADVAIRTKDTRKAREAIGEANGEKGVRREEKGRQGITMHNY